MRKIIFWNDEIANEGFKSDVTTWFRCMGIGDFINKVGKENIAGVILEPSGDESENNIGFILKQEIDSDEPVGQERNNVKKKTTRKEIL